MSEQMTFTVFSYAYQSLRQRAGGFMIELKNNNVLVFSTFDDDRNILSQELFSLGAEVRIKYLRSVSYAAPWLRSVPDRMTGGVNGADAIDEISIGIDRYPVFRVENMHQLMAIGFGSARSHYCRLLAAFLEDFACLLAPYGISMQLDSFTWDPNQTMPFSTWRAARKA